MLYNLLYNSPNMPAQTNIEYQLKEASQLTNAAWTALAEREMGKWRVVTHYRLGKKTQRGFYEYHNGRIANAPQNSGAGGREAEIVDRLLLRLLNEAIACLREGVVDDADLVDAGMVFGTGFAPFRGGPMAYLRARGAEELRARLHDLSAGWGAGFRPDPGWDDARLWQR